ncbi:MAG: hypothetical protein K1060chlam2_00560 [Chlamydiae bacterium]|nr:hypothetical protein [Chlamydiota bacterium]
MSSIGQVTSAQSVPPAGHGKVKKKKSSSKKDSDSLSGSPEKAFVGFWEACQTVAYKISWVRDFAANAWKDSIHLLIPDYQGREPDLSAKKPPKEFTDEMKKKVSPAIAEHYQRVMNKYQKLRIDNTNDLAELGKAFTSLCHASYSDPLDKDDQTGIDRCHNALAHAIKAYLGKNPTEVHIGSTFHQELSSDFFTAFCPQLRRSQSITDLYIHGSFACNEDREKLMNAIEQTGSIVHLHFDLDRESSEHIISLLPPLIENIQGLTTITLHNYDEDRSFVVENALWDRLNRAINTRPNFTKLQLEYTPQPTTLQIHKLSFEQ